MSLDAFVIAGNPSLLFSSLGVSLDACVVAGNTFFSFPFFFFFLLFSPYPSLPRARCNRFSLRFGFIGSRPLHLFPFSPFPFTHFCSPLFFRVLLSSCLSISFLLSFAHTSVPALVCTRTFTCTSKPKFQVAQVFTMRWGSSVVPVHLVPLSSQPRTLLSCLVLSSCLQFLFLLRAHVRIRPNLRFSRLPSGRRVCITLGVTGILIGSLFLSAAGWSQVGGPHLGVNVTTPHSSTAVVCFHGVCMIFT